MNQIMSEFKLLDIAGTSRLDFHSIHNAVKLFGLPDDDEIIRRWILTVDKGRKGYVTYSDYLSIFVDGEQGMIQTKNLTHQSLRNMSVIPKDSTVILEQTFRKYDCDNDGLITVEDLEKAFSGVSNGFPKEDFRSWVDMRDRSDKGGVCFDDFCHFFNL